MQGLRNERKMDGERGETLNEESGVVRGKGARTVLICSNESSWRAANGVNEYNALLLRFHPSTTITLFPTSKYGIHPAFISG